MAVLPTAMVWLRGGVAMAKPVATVNGHGGGSAAQAGVIDSDRSQDVDAVGRRSPHDGERAGGVGASESCRHRGKVTPVTVPLPGAVST